MIPTYIFAGALVLQGAIFAGAMMALIRYHAQDRADLLNRIMARDFLEYQATAKKSESEKRHHNVLERQREAIMRRQLEEEPN